jgi:predicted cobalt transporter CbtA
VNVYIVNSILLPGSNNKKKALVLAGIMFFVLFLIPTLKYPANPPGVGNPQTIYFREILYVGFIATSGFTALALVFAYGRFENNNSLSSKNTIILPVIYAIVMVTAYLLFPPNPDKVTMSGDLISNFRIAGIFTIGLFWWLMGITLGSFWDKFKPHQTSKISSI